MVRDIARYVVLGGIFLLPFLPLVVSYSLFFPFITGKNFLFRVIVEIIFAAWVILACYEPKYRPRFSYILAAVLSLLGIMAVANALGESPHKSFWSNYERMDGYVTLAHLALYFLVAGSVLVRERFWNVFWNISLLVATIMMFYGFCQLSGNGGCPISQSDFRIDGRMGNAAYLAIYMFFHVFIALVLLVRTKSVNLQIGYGVLALGFVYILTQTGTRGTTLALFGGAFLAAAYIALFGRKHRFMRNLAIGAVLAVVIVATGLYAAKDTAFIKENGALNRLASVSLTEGATRFTIWGIAWEGFKERPLLGWGQENFNYVFSAHYEPSLYAQEPWFDRVHNIAFDWLIAGGILGFLAYVSIILSTLYYVVLRPLWRKEDSTLSLAERGLIFGLLAGYVAHNLLVFDNLISYFFFFSIIAMVHGDFAKTDGRLARVTISPLHITQVIAPVVVVVLALTLYFVNVPGIRAAGILIEAFDTTATLEERLTSFERALESGTFARQEIREQLGQATQKLVQDDTLLAQYERSFPAEEAAVRVAGIQNAYAARTDAELKAQLLEMPRDIRIMTFQSTFYRATNSPQEAIAVMERALELSPRRPQLYFELAFALVQAGDVTRAQETFREGMLLEPTNGQARMFYAASALLTGDRASFDEMTTPEYEDAYLASEYLLHVAYQEQYYDIAIDIMEKRAARNPADLKARLSLTFMYFESGDREAAIRTLESAVKDFPSFKAEGEQYIEQLRTVPMPTR